MLHKFLEPGDWFAAKSYGYGAGLPIAWQGWVLVAGFILCALGFGLLIETGDFVWIAIGTVSFVLATVAFAIVARKRTRGGWKWRSGDKE